MVTPYCYTYLAHDSSLCSTQSSLPSLTLPLSSQCSPPFPRPSPRDNQLPLQQHSPVEQRPSPASSISETVKVCASAPPALHVRPPTTTTLVGSSRQPSGSEAR